MKVNGIRNDVINLTTLTSQRYKESSQPVPACSWVAMMYRSLCSQLTVPNA